MKSLFNFFQVVITSFGGYLGWLLGGVDGFMYALIFLIIVDYFTGIMVAILGKNLSSEIGFRGIFKKILILMLVGVANVMDIYLIKNGSAIRTAVIFFYASNEGISILENSVKIGLPVQKKLRNILKQLKSQGGNENE
ncbi:MAG: phage holin family protein [Clostridiales bacterium]|nr:phage holin family protein [Clostridiales bacterium]